MPETNIVVCITYQFKFYCYEQICKLYSLNIHELRGGRIELKIVDFKVSFVNYMIHRITVGYNNGCALVMIISIIACLFGY